MAMIPPARGGQARIVKPVVSRPPKAPRSLPQPAVKTPTQTAMDTFHQALTALRAATPAVDTNAIYQPYRASQQVAGQLGVGLQSAEQAAGQAAQNQYAAGRDVAQQHAAQFGIGAGSGAAPTSLADTGTGALAAQTQAYAASAPQASNAWQQALERSAAAKVSDAQLARAQGLTSAEQSLSGNIPSLIDAEKTRAFQAKTEKFNEGLAQSQLTEKQTQGLRDYLLGAAKVKQSAATAADSSAIKRASLTEKTQNDAAKLRVSQDALALKKRAAKATATGLKGVAAATKALSGSPSKGTKPVVAYNVKYLADPNGINAGGPAVTLTVKDPNSAKPPAGYTKPTDSLGTPVYGQAGAGSTSGLTAKQWDVQMRSLLAQNPGRNAEIKAFLGPRPKK